MVLNCMQSLSPLCVILPSQLVSSCSQPPKHKKSPLKYKEIPFVLKINGNLFFNFSLAFCSLESLCPCLIIFFGRIEGYEFDF